MQIQFDELLDAIAKRLILHGLDATVEYPGYIHVNGADFGNANDFWGWDRENGDYGDLPNAVASDSEDVSAITDGILLQLKYWQE
jgi:hypothetical protein